MKAHIITKSPTPGSVQSLRERGQAEDYARRIEALREGTKKVCSVDFTEPPVIPKGMLGIRTADSSLMLLANDTPDGWDAVRSVFQAQRLRGEEKWRGLGRAFGYSEEEIEEFISQHSNL